MLEIKVFLFLEMIQYFRQEGYLFDFMFLSFEFYLQIRYVFVYFFMFLFVSC